MRSNCIVWSLVRYAGLARQWWRDGKPVGYEPAIRIRCSRLEPRKTPHFAVEHWTGAGWVREEWVPLNKEPLPWWRLWKALWTDGEIVTDLIR